jgi:hypothetical protein
VSSGDDRRPHLWIRQRASDRAFTRTGRGNQSVRDVERRAHGRARRQELTDSIEHQLARRSELDQFLLEELKAQGVIVVLEGADATYPLRVDSLQRLTTHREQRAQWLLLSITPAAGDQPEKAMVWISDEYRERFLKLFEQYENEDTPNGNARNRQLVANIARIRHAVLRDLWQSEGEPSRSGEQWWELWLTPGEESTTQLRTFAAGRPIHVADRVLRLVDRTVAWVRSAWSELEVLPFTGVPLAEIRKPELADTVEDLSVEEQDELATDLASRIRPAPLDAPAVCHLDTGIRASHLLIAPSIDADDVHSVVDDAGADAVSHGTAMATLALIGPLDDLLLSTATVDLDHRLESVKILPDPGTTPHDPLAYGLVTAQAVSQPEAVSARARVFCMPVTAPPDHPGQPSLWSASVDALSAGVDIAAADDGIALLNAPAPAAGRLFIVSAGNVSSQDFQADYRAACDTSVVEDPAHAYNALAVGAYTELVAQPTDPAYEHWSVVGTAGDISPHSRTSLLFDHRSWPIKPDICMEGGNLLYDGVVDFHGSHPLLSLRTGDSKADAAIGSANATSAATAQAARLAVLAQVRYPEYWPETIRGLLTHAAEWTSVMRDEINAQVGKAEKLRMLRRYGWGVPTAERVLDSSAQSVTLVTQDAFVPFTGTDFRSRTFRLHELPWPTDVLREDLAAADVTLRVTLSYFIEPTASRRGWRRRYSYASHGLRFELKNPTESVDEFVSRVNREAQDEEDERPRVKSGSDRWLVGPNQRNQGSLHQDVWEGSGADLAACSVLAVHSVGGWWKYNRRRDRMDQGVRYALIVSLKTREEDVDLWTPVASQIGVPVEEVVVAT